MKTNRGTLRTPRRTDLTRQPHKLRGPTCCPGCGAVCLLAAHRGEILARDKLLQVSWSR